MNHDGLISSELVARVICTRMNSVLILMLILILLHKLAGQHFMSENLFPKSF